MFVCIVPPRARYASAVPMISTYTQVLRHSTRSNQGRAVGRRHGMRCTPPPSAPPSSFARGTPAPACSESCSRSTYSLSTTAYTPITYISIAYLPYTHTCAHTCTGRHARRIRRPAGGHGTARVAGVVPGSPQRPIPGQVCDFNTKKLRMPPAALAPTMLRMPP